MSTPPVTSTILIYQTDDGQTQVDVRLEDETIWLTQSRMAELFDVNVPAISKHLNNIFKEGELQKETTVSKMETVQQEGGRQVTRSAPDSPHVIARSKTTKQSPDPSHVIARSMATKQSPDRSRFREIAAPSARNDGHDSG